MLFQTDIIVRLKFPNNIYIYCNTFPAVLDLSGVTSKTCQYNELPGILLRPHYFDLHRMISTDYLVEHDIYNGILNNLYSIE